MKIAQVLLWALLAALLNACGSTAPAALGDNYAYLYGKRTNSLRFDARVYHLSDQQSKVYFRLRTADLLYKAAGPGKPFETRVELSYRIYTDWDLRTLIDSATATIVDHAATADSDQEMIGELLLKSVPQQEFVLLLSARDMQREAQGDLVLGVRRTQGGRQDHLPVDSAGVPLFSDQLDPGSLVMVHNARAAGRTVQVDQYAALVRLPRPVFADAQGEEEAQRVDTWQAVFDSAGVLQLRMPDSGFMHLRGDTASADGFTLYALHESYPFVDDVEDLVAPLRYITSNAEWDRIIKGSDRRREVERFWLSSAGERKRAREAIRTYYGRVENANRYFTGRTEGWRTDRGLAHIIFGPPNTIRRTTQGETWIYGEESNLLSLSLTFTRRKGPFSGNDLVLRRDPAYRSAWYRNVESWRNGRVMQN